MHNLHSWGEIFQNFPVLHLSMSLCNNSNWYLVCTRMHMRNWWSMSLVRRMLWPVTSPRVIQTTSPSQTRPASCSSPWTTPRTSAAGWLWPSVCMCGIWTLVATIMVCGGFIIISYLYISLVFHSVHTRK